MTRLVAAEFVKLRTTWGLWVYLALMLGVVALGVAGSIASLEDPFSREDAESVLGTPGFAVFFVTLLGAVGFTNEFRHATIGQTLLITPRRERVLAVKLVSFALVGIGFGIAAIVLTLAIAVPWLGAKGFDVELTGELVRTTTLGVLGACVLLAIFGTAIGGAVRNQVAAVVGILVWFLLVEQLIVALLEVIGVEGVGPYLPAQASGLIVGDPNDPDPELSQAAAALVMLGWTALAAGAAALSLRRDVS
jgi:hypothetical protein